LDDLRATKLDHRVIHRDDGLSGSLLCRLKGSLDLARPQDWDRLKYEPQFRSRWLQFLHLQTMTRRIAVPYHRHANHVWRHFFPQLQTLATLFVAKSVSPVTLPPGCAKLA